MVEANILLKYKYRTVITTENKKYTIEESPNKGIEMLIEPARPNILDEFTIRLWIPVGTKSSEQVIESGAEVSIYPIPKKVLEDIQERTNKNLYIEDVSEYYGYKESGKGFFIRANGHILLATI